MGSNNVVVAVAKQQPVKMGWTRFRGLTLVDILDKETLITLQIKVAEFFLKPESHGDFHTSYSQNVGTCKTMRLSE